MFMIRVAMGAVKIRIDPEASPFRGDAYFEGPGAQTNHFLNNMIFLNIFFKNSFRTNRFRDIFLLKNRFRKNGVGVSLLGGGQARKMTPVIYPLVFKNSFGHENSRRGSYGNNSERFLGQNFTRMPNLRSNRP